MRTYGTQNAPERLVTLNMGDPEEEGLYGYTWLPVVGVDCRHVWLLDWGGFFFLNLQIIVKNRGSDLL